MKRQGWISGLLLAATLTGCGAEEAKMVLKQPEEPARTEKAEQGEKADPAPTRLLLSEEAMAYMYQDGRPNGFDFGGVEEDGAFSMSSPARRSRTSAYESAKMKRRRLCIIMVRRWR